MIRSRPLLALAAAAAALAGCDVSGSEEKQPQKPAEKKAQAPPDERVIRAWSRALNAGKYELAGSFFAPKALVDQGEPFRLPSAAAAVVFNRSLPCKGEVTAIEDEGPTTLASFRLRRGPGGPCEGEHGCASRSARASSRSSASCPAGSCLRATRRERLVFARHDPRVPQSEGDAACQVLAVGCPR